MIESGKVVLVATRRVGTSLVGDHASGATILQMLDRAEFSEAGGQLLVGDDTLTFTSWDGDTDLEPLTVTSPTTADYEDGTGVYVVPATTETTATVVLDQEGEGIEVDVPHTLIPQLAEGTRAEGEQETVLLEATGGIWELIDVVKETPLIDGGFLDPETVPPPPPPTTPPAAAPVVTVSPFAIGAVRPVWDSVDDAQWYNVYASLTSGFDSDDPANLNITGVTGLETMVSQIDGVQIPVDGTPVYVVVKAANAAGEGPASDEVSAIARQADVEFLSALYGWFGTIEAQNAMFGTLNVLISISTDGAINVGPRITIDTPNTVDGSGGITIWGDDAHTIVLVRLHPNGSTFDGTITAEDITVLDSLRLLGNASALASGSEFFLENGIADPAAPTLSAGPIKSTWPAVPAGYTQKGICWDAANGQWLRLHQNNANLRGYVQPVSTVGVAGTNIALGHDGILSVPRVAVGVSGVTVLGSDLYYGLLYDDRTSPIAAVVKCAVSTGASSDSVPVTISPSGAPLADEIAVGNDGTNIYTVSSGTFAHQPPSSGVFITKWDTTLTQVGTGTQLTGASLTAARRFCAVTDLGYGSAKITVASASSVDVYALGTFSGDSVAKNSGLSWTLDATLVAGGIGYKTSGSDQGFYSTHNDQKLSRWDSYYPGASEKVYAKTLDIASSGVTTAASPISAGLAVAARRFVTVALSALPDGVVDSAVFVGYGTSTPADTALFRRVTPEVIAGRSMTLTAGKIVTGTPLQITITNRQLTSNVAKLTIGSHSMAVGQKITVAGVPSDTFFNGTFVLTAVGATDISYSLVHANVSATSSSGSVTRDNGLGGTPSKMYDGFGNTWTGDGVVDLPGLTTNEAHQVALPSTINVAVTSNVTLTGLAQDVECPGTTAIYMVTIDADVQIGSTATTNSIELLVDGTAQAAVLNSGGVALFRAAVSKTWLVTGLAAGTRSFTARAHNSSAQSVNVFGTHTLMTVKRAA